MSNYINLTADEIIDYMLENNCGIRQTALHFGCSVGLIWNRINGYSGEKKDSLSKQFYDNINRSRKNLKCYSNTRKD